jgi:hypothetical protein
VNLFPHIRAPSHMCATSFSEEEEEEEEEEEGGPLELLLGVCKLLGYRMFVLMRTFGYVQGCLNESPFVVILTQNLY